MKNLTLILSVLLLSSTVKAQDYGYFGKKNIVTITGAFSPRLASNLFITKQYQSQQGTFPMSFGGSFRYERQLSKNQFIGVELGIHNTGNHIQFANNVPILEVHQNDPYYDPYYNSYYEYSTLKTHAPLSVMVYAPSINFSRAYSGHLAPVGIVNTLGGGLLIAKVKQKDYYKEFDAYNLNEWTPETFMAAEEKTYSESLFRPMYGLRFYWQTALNIPITKNIMWSLAVRGNVNLYLSALTRKNTTEDEVYMINRSTFVGPFANGELYTILELNTGLKITF